MNFAESLSKLKDKRWLVVAALLAISIVIYFTSQKLMGPKVTVEVVRTEDIVQTIVASGHVQAPQRIEIGSQIIGTVASIPVIEGQPVKARQLLISLEDSEANAQVAQARASVGQAQARLNQITKLGLPAAKQSLKQAQINHKNVAKQHARTKTLQARGFVGQSTLDDAQKNLDLAASQERVAQLQVTTNAVGGSDFLVATTALAQAQASLDITVAKLGYSTIEAPVDGTLIARNVERGDVVQPGKVLMVLSPTGPTQLVVQIDERNLADLRIGEKALAAADAFPSLTFPAEIAYINPAVDALRGSVEVKLNVPAPPAHLRQDMTVSVDIEVASRAKALVLTLEAIHESASASPWVMKITDGRARRQAVKLGLRGGGKVEVIEGLRSGDQVSPATGKAVTDGTRLRARPKTDRQK
jgi:HlyD family secretion protein